MTIRIKMKGKLHKYIGEDWSRVDTPGENSRTESD